MSLLKIPRRTIAIDWDGTLFPEDCWTKHDECVGELFVGAVEFLRALYKKYDLVIFSARAGDHEGRMAIHQFLVKNKLVGLFTEITNIKRHTFYKIVDDRAFRCIGNNDYASILKELGC